MFLARTPSPCHNECMASNLTLTRTISTPGTESSNWLLHLVIGKTGTSTLPVELFVMDCYRPGVITPGQDTFACVAQISHLHTFGVDPSADTSPSYRTSTVTLAFPNSVDLEDTYTLIAGDLSELAYEFGVSETTPSGTTSTETFPITV